MDTIEFIRQAIADTHAQVDDSMTGMTEEQFNSVPAGTANPISAVFLHCLNSEDFFIQKVIQDQPRLWEAQGWGEKTDVTETPGYGGNWEAFKHRTLALQPVLDYQKVVRAATDTYLSKVTPAELERIAKFPGGDRSVAKMLILLITHTLCHAGEIAVLKGIQGVKGLPY
ncbi:MAG: DinB family protein [Anaerolineaceae bacterium]|nr:DinB family protein [Anaerolineaceae bacterium]